MGYRGAESYRLQGEKYKRYYLGGFRCVLQDMRKHYPGWIVRVYTNLEARALCDYACEKDFFICDVRKLPVQGMLGKFCVSTEIKKLFPEVTIIVLQET